MCKKIMAASLMLSLLLTATAWASAASEEETLIKLSDSGVTVDGESASTDDSSAVYVGADIIYYVSGQDDSYGAGTEADAHDADEAEGHTVVTITQPGTYRLTGTLSAGQVAVDLGEDAAEDPDAVVTLILDGVDITCTVAPAIIFYNVYECGDSSSDNASPTVDTAEAGANVILADGSVNNVQGSYVAKIYKEGTEKKLHKYDGAFYSKMSMNIDGESPGTGVLNITAENEGLDSELHLTINGGVINITAQDDGINTNEDGVSVTTVNGGVLTINAGLGEEGDGIDSNGYLVVNGGTITSLANGRTGDGGLDSDMGVYLNGGTIVALGSRNDEVSSESGQPYMALSFSSVLPAGTVITVKDAAGNTLVSYTAVKEFSAAELSSADFQLGGTYSVYINGVQQQYTGTGRDMGPGGMGGQAPEDGTMPDLPEGARQGTPPDGQSGETPSEGMTPPDGATSPDGVTPPENGDGTTGGQPDGTGSTAFTLSTGSMSFSGVSDVSDLPFTDVASGSQWYEGIEYVYRAGVMSGTSDTTFEADTPVSRAMAVTVLARLAQAQAGDTADFSDVATGSWYSGYVGWAVANGVVQGDGAGRFLPDQSVTGEQMELILTRYASLLGKSYTASNTSTLALTRGELAQMLLIFNQA